MKFVQKNLEKSADVSSGEGSQLSELAKLAAMALALLVGLYFLVGIVVDIVVANLSIETEKKLFKNFDLSSVASDEYGDEMGENLKRVKEIMFRLSAHPETPRLDYQLLLIKNDRPNAFAFPGGGIGVSTALLDNLQEEVSIAFVIGHELGHFKNRDHLRGLGRALGLSICYALIFQDSAGGETIGKNALFLMNRKYSQRQEKEADRFGVRLVHDSYGDSGGMERFFRLLKDEDKLPKWAYMLSTHPNPEERVDRMMQYSKELKKEGG